MIDTSKLNCFLLQTFISGYIGVILCQVSTCAALRESPYIFEKKSYGSNLDKLWIGLKH